MKKIIYLIALISLLTACEEFLDRPPVSRISTDQYWKTQTDIENYTLQFYQNTFPDHRWYSPIRDEAFKGIDHQIVMTPVPQLTGTRNVVTSGGNWTWDRIRAVNIFFENYKKADVTPDNIKPFVGEAHFFKAWFYFEKVRLYGDVPWFTNSLQMNSTELYKPRDSRIVVIDSILWHLDKAIENLPLLKSAVGGNNRLSKEAALIFKSRVALFEGTWQKYHAGTSFGTAGTNPNKYLQSAADAVTELMTPGKYTVGIFNTGKPASDYNTLFSSKDLGSNKEVILCIDYDNTQSFSHSFQKELYAHNQVCVTNELISNYLKRDGTPYEYINVGTTTKGIAFLSKIALECDPRLAQVIDIPGALMYSKGSTGYFVRPYLFETGERYNSTGFQLRKGLDPSVLDGSIAHNTSFETSCVTFRYAEALLNYAEAQAEMGQPVDYANSLDLLRSRAGMPAFAVITDPNRAIYADFGYEISDELYEIRRERAVELGCEGYRFDDWRRWRAHNLFLNKRPKGFPYLESDYSDYPNLVINTDVNGLVDPFQKVLPNGYQFNAARDYLDCIPTNEITLNPALTQNPGW